MCMFRSLRYLSNFCLMRLSQADAFLPKLSCNLVLFCFVFYPAVLFFLPSSPACSFCLSAGDVCSACQWAFTRVPCLLLRDPLCSSANPLFKCTQQRRAVSVIFGFFLIISWLWFLIFASSTLPVFHTETCTQQKQQLGTTV